MTAQQKRTFIRDLLANVKRELLSKVPKMPETWDGIELRQFAADKFNDAAHGGALMTGRRKSDYHNEVIVRNL
jgi:hypothetical protein